MIIDENEMEKESQNEKLLVGLCECNLLLNYQFDSKLLSICVPCLLNFALKKEESEEMQKEVEMAFLTLSCIGEYFFIERKLYLNKLMEVIRYHQEHQNLTQLAFESAWKFLITEFFNDKSLEEVFADELHFARDTRRELEELTRSVDWKKKEEEMNKEEANEVLVIRRWVKALKIYIDIFQLRNEEYVGLFSKIVQVLRAAKGNNEEISSKCINSLRNEANNQASKVKDFLKSGAVDIVLHELHQTTLKDAIARECFDFFLFDFKEVEREYR